MLKSGGGEMESVTLQVVMYDAVDDLAHAHRNLLCS